MSAEYASLRAELKVWERDFQNEHGRKATPEDIRLVDGLVQKYKRFKILSKNEGKQPAASGKTGVADPTTSTSIIKHAKVTENDRDPLPTSAKPNPFSPIKKSTAGQPAKPLSTHSVPEFLSFPNLLSTPVKKSANKAAMKSPTSPNPFVIPTLRLQPDSPFTAARKRIRGEEQSDPLPPDKKRKFMNRSQSTSLSGPFSAGPSSSSFSQASLFDMLAENNEVLEDSPVKPSTLNGEFYTPIFDDVPIKPTSTRGITSRTVSLPATMLFAKRSDSQNRPASQPLSATSRSTDTKSTVEDSHSSTHSGEEDEEMEDLSAQSTTQGKTLLAPTPVKGENSNRWKNTKKWTKGGKKGKETANLQDADEDDEDIAEESEVAMMEVGWRIMGPLRPKTITKPREDENVDEEMRDDDDENFQFPLTGRPWTSRSSGDEGELEPEKLEVDLPEEMREILELSLSKPKVDEELLVQDLIAGGRGDRLKQAEIWLPGEFEEGEDSEEWEGEGASWWDAEL